ncbi:MAG: hypothetical protein LBQ64_05085, partial [Bacteroidales bacterium]|nr:hypothetical protein [Bacteroidales bacterium]
GPLAFLKIPTATGHNFFIALLFFSTLKLFFIHLLFRLSQSVRNSSKTTLVVVAFVASFFAFIDFLIVGSCLILAFLFCKKQSLVPFIICVVLAFTGLFIKVSIGVSSFCIIGVSVLICLFRTRNGIALLKQIGIILGTGLLAGILVFGSLKLYFHFLTGVVSLSGGYGDTLSLHPDNNWFVVIPCLVLLLAFPFFHKGKDVRILYVLSFLPLFAMWKHSFIREDIYHYRIFITFLVIFWCLVLLVSDNKRIQVFLTACVTVLLLYINMHSLPMYSGINKEMAGINNFMDVLHYREFKQKMLTKSEQSIAINKLDEQTRTLIGDNTIDIYPWEFSYIATNQLKWKPRQTLELGASTSRKSSEKASEHYQGDENSPQFLLFHLEPDPHGGTFGSLDGRYMLNDEPLLIRNLLKNYRLIKTTDKFLLFQKDSSLRFETVALDKIQTVSFGQWIDIPDSPNTITQLNVFSRNRWIGYLHKLLYKEVEYYIDYLLDDGIMLTYRYIPSTAVDGLWCNPFIRHPHTCTTEPKAIKVRLRNSSSICVRSDLQIQFRRIKIHDTDTVCVSAENCLFGKTASYRQTLIRNYLHHFDDNQAQYSGEISDEASTSGNFSNKISKNGYSYTYEIDLDTLWTKTEQDALIIEANAQILNYSDDAALVISVEETDCNSWQAVYFTRSIAKDLWYAVYLSQKVYRKEHLQGKIKVYVFNNGDKSVYLDDFKLRISGQ